MLPERPRRPKCSFRNLTRSRSELPPDRYYRPNHRNFRPAELSPFETGTSVDYTFQPEFACFGM
jgi:hypothetical protein